MYDYETKTNAWERFCNVEFSGGITGVIQLYHELHDKWKDNYIYFTELVMVLNWRLWFWWDHDRELAKLYNDLWLDADEYAIEHYTGEELSYFVRTTD